MEPTDQQVSHAPLLERVQSCSLASYNEKVRASQPTGVFPQSQTGWDKRRLRKTQSLFLHCHLLIIALFALQTYTPYFCLTLQAEM